MNNPTHNDFISPEGAPNVRFISSKVQPAAALAEYSKALTLLFNQSVKMLLLAKNASVTRESERQLSDLLVDTQKVCARLCACSKAAKGPHTSGNLFRYLRYLLEKAEDYPTVDLFYEIASVAEVLAEGFDAARVC